MVSLWTPLWTAVKVELSEIIYTNTCIFITAERQKNEATYSFQSYSHSSSFPSSRDLCYLPPSPSIILWASLEDCGHNFFGPQQRGCWMRGAGIFIGLSCYDSSRHDIRPLLVLRHHEFLDHCYRHSWPYRRCCQMIQYPWLPTIQYKETITGKERH
jgi:hypothetical protein